jgi:RND family efflux transporter MFP subunit
MKEERLMAIEHDRSRTVIGTLNLALGLTGTLAVTIALAACGGGEAKELEQGAGAVQMSRLVNVEVERVGTVAFTDQVGIVGVVAANREVTVAAEEGGVIRSIEREKGTRVQAGEPLARIDDALLLAQLRQAAADAELARETHERQRRLWEEEKIGTELAYLQARYAAERAAANLQLLQERVERTTIRAPISGILDARLIEVGSMVAAGTPVARIVDLSRVKVVGGVPERFAAEVALGARALLNIEGMNGMGANAAGANATGPGAGSTGARPRVLEGRISFVGASVNEEDRTFPIEVVVADPGPVKPGMVVTVGIDRRTLESAVVVPQEAVVRTEGVYIVYVAAERSGVTLAEARPVVTGPSRRGRIVIESGLVAGEEVVVVGQQRVVPGDRLQVVRRSAGGDDE